MELTAGVLPNLTLGGLYVLRGPRRVGKAQEVKRAIEDRVASGVASRRIAHVSVDGLRSRPPTASEVAPMRIPHSPLIVLTLSDFRAGIDDEYRIAGLSRP